MNKFSFYYILLLITIAIFNTACDDNDSSINSAIRPQGDEIIVGTDTFHIFTQDIAAPAISAQPDSFIIGEFYSSKYGSTKAELFVQFAPPVEYEFPQSEYNPTPDSLVLLLYYYTWFGSAYAPFELSIYEMNKDDIVYSQQYLSDILPSQFTDSTILMGKSIATTLDQTRIDSLGADTATVPYIRYVFDQTQLERFFNIPESAYETEDAFLEQFKGIYITTTYGASTLVYLNQISLYMYYSYTYEKNGVDTLVNTSIIYPANTDVRQLNRFYHADVQDIIDQRPDSLNYIKSSAGIYPKLQIPIGRISQRLNDSIGDKQLQINSAIINVECVDYDDEDVYMNPSAYILALTEDQYDDFVKYNTIPTSNDSTAVIGTYYSDDDTGDKYVIDMSYFLTKYLRDETITPDQTVDVLLVPVVVESTTSNYVTSVTSIKPLAMLSAISVRSGQNEYSPMRMEILYSGF